MKYETNLQPLPFLAAGAGLTALILRILLSILGRDEKGLLLPAHPLALLLWVLTAAAALVILLQIGKLGGSARYQANFAPSRAASAGCFAMALGVFLSLFLIRGTGLRLELLRSLAGILAVPALVWVGVCRAKGLRPFFGLHALVCLYLTLHTICRYQSWSSQPQLLNFLFPMAGCVLMMVFSYCQTAFDVGLGQRRTQLGAGMLGAFFCFAAIAGLQDIPLYAAGGAWMLTNLCSLTPQPRRRRSGEAGEEPA